MPPAPKIILYEHIDFKGKTLELSGNDLDFRRHNFNDIVSSIVVISGQWTLYEHINFGGRSITIGPGRYRWIEDLGMRNDLASSVKLLTATPPPPPPPPTSDKPAVVLHMHADFIGDTRTYHDDMPDLRADGFNDTVSSITIHHGHWAFYEHINFTGKSIVLGPGKYRWVEENGFANDTLSSIKLLDKTPPPPPPSNQPPEVVLHQHIDFAGTAMVFKDDVPDLRAVGFNDTVSSITIRGGRWTFYEHVGFTGTSVTLGPGSYRWVEAIGFQNDIMSSVKLLDKPVVSPPPPPPEPSRPTPLPEPPTTTPPPLPPVVLPPTPIDLQPILTHIDQKLADALQALGLRIDMVQGQVQSLAQRVDNITGGVGDLGGKVGQVQTVVDNVQDTVTRIDKATKIPETVLETVREMDLEYGTNLLLASPHGSFLTLQNPPRAAPLPLPTGLIMSRADNPDFRGTARYGDLIHLADPQGSALTTDTTPALAKATPATRWTLVDPADPANTGPVPRFGVFQLRSPQGTYLGTRPDGTLEAIRDTPGPWETWSLALPPGAVVAIQSQSNNMFLRVGDASEGRRIEASSTSPTDPRSQFILLRTRDAQGRPWIGFRSLYDDLNVQMTPGFVLRTENRNFQDPAHTWEHFRAEGNHIFSRSIGGYLNHIPDAHRRTQEILGHASGNANVPSGKEPSAQFRILGVPATVPHVRAANEAIAAWHDVVEGVRTAADKTLAPVSSVLPPGTTGLLEDGTPGIPKKPELPPLETPSPIAPLAPALPPTEVQDLTGTFEPGTLADLVKRHPTTQGTAVEEMDGRRIGLVLVYVHDPTGATRGGIPIRLLVNDKLADMVRTDARGIALMRYPRRLSDPEGMVGMVEYDNGDKEQHRQAMFHIPAGRQHAVTELVLDELPITDGIGDDPLRRLPPDFGVDVFDDVIRLLGQTEDPLLGGREGSNRFASRRAPMIKRARLVRNGPDQHNKNKQYLVSVRQEWVFLGYSLGEMTNLESLTPGTRWEETERSLEQTLEELQDVFSRTTDVSTGLVERAARQVQNMVSSLSKTGVSNLATDTSSEVDTKTHAETTSVGLNLLFFNVNHTNAKTHTNTKARASLRSQLRTSALENASSSASLENNSTLRETQQRVNEAIQRVSNTQRNLQSTKSRVLSQVAPLLSRATNLLNWQIYENYAVATRIEDVVEVARNPVVALKPGQDLFSAEDIVEYAPLFAPQIKQAMLLPNFLTLATLVEEFRAASSPVRTLQFDVQFSAPTCSAILRIRVGNEETSIRLRRGQSRAKGHMRLDHPMTAQQLARTPAQITLVAGSDYDRPAPVMHTRMVERDYFFGKFQVPEQYHVYPEPSYRVEVNELEVAFTTTKDVPLSARESFGTDFHVTHKAQRAENRMDMTVPALPSLPTDDPLYLHVNRNASHYLGILMEAALDDPSLRHDSPQLRALSKSPLWNMPLLGFEAGEALILKDITDADTLGQSILHDEGAATIVQLAAPGSYGEVLQGVLELTDLKGRIPPQLMAQLQTVPEGSKIVDPNNPTAGPAEPGPPSSNEPQNPGGLPKTNGVPTIPGGPALPATPATPSAPATPGVPALPAVPSVPSVPSVPI